MDMFVKEGNVDKAVEFYSLISWTNIEAGYHKKVLDFSTLLLQNDRTEEALQARYQFRGRHDGLDRADALAATPDVFPGLGTGVAAGTEIHG